MTDEIEVSEAEAQPIETKEPMSGESPEQSGSTALEQEDKPDEPLFSEKGQQLFNSKMAEEKRAKRELEQKLEEAEAERQRLAAQLPQSQRPEVPLLPNEYDFDTTEQYQDAIRRRDDSIRELAAFEASERVQQEQLVRSQEEQIRLQNEQIQKTVQDFQTNAKKHGVSDEEVNQSIAQVNAYGISQDLGMHIMARPDGPLVTKYLANNPLELDTINSLSPLQAAVYVESQVAPKAASLKPKTTSAPDPVETLKGTGVPPRERGPAGATYT